MQRRDVEIVNTLGLHARASAKLTQLAVRYASEVAMVRNGRRVNAKSIMGVMMLAAGKGAMVTLETDGPDEEEALDALAALIGDCFGEGAVSIRAPAPHAMSSFALHGIGVSRGIAIGRAQLVSHATLEVRALRDRAGRTRRRDRALRHRGPRRSRSSRASGAARVVRRRAGGIRRLSRRALDDPQATRRCPRCRARSSPSNAATRNGR